LAIPNGSKIMKAKWLILNIGKDNHINELFYGVQECGRTAEVIPLKDFYEMLETPSPESACIVTSGSIWANSYVRKQRPNWVGNWHDESLFTCSRYYSYWGKYITQQNYVMLPFSEIRRRMDWLYSDIGFEDEIFIRPDSGAKEFVGEVVSRGRFNAWETEAKNGENWKSDLLCVVAKPQNIDREFRFVIKNGKVVTGSTYRLAKHISMERMADIDDISAVIAFAEQALADNPPPLPPVHVLDIADCGGKFSILEVGCYCCAGLYESDRRKIALAVSEAAEEEFASKNNS